jgi:glycerophosphoryl diester phosphodiesterase
MAAYLYAAAHGANAIEGDVRWSANASKFMMHDVTLDRTTDCTGPLETKTLTYLKACDAGSWFGPAFAGQKIPAFVDLLRFASTHGIGVVAEVKPGSTYPLTASHAGALSDAIYRFGMQSRTLVSSFSGPALQKVRTYDRGKQLSYVLAASKSTEYTAAQVRGFGAAIVSPPSSDLTEAIVRSYHAGGVKVWPFAVRSQASIDKVRAAGVDGVFSDDPAQT